MPLCLCPTRWCYGVSFVLDGGSCNQPFMPASHCFMTGLDPSWPVRLHLHTAYVCCMYSTQQRVAGTRLPDGDTDIREHTCTAAEAAVCRGSAERLRNNKFMQLLKETPARAVEPRGCTGKRTDWSTISLITMHVCSV